MQSNVRNRVLFNNARAHLEIVFRSVLSNPTAVKYRGIVRYSVFGVRYRYYVKLDFPIPLP